MPKVSVILPVYNVAPYLDEAMQSLFNQTFQDFEIIAVNDGLLNMMMDNRKHSCVVWVKY